MPTNLRWELHSTLSNGTTLRGTYATEVDAEDAREDLRGHEHEMSWIRKVDVAAGTITVGNEVPSVDGRSEYTYSAKT